MTKDKDKYNKTETGEKCKAGVSVPLLILFKAKDNSPLLHMSCMNIKDADTDKVIPQFI